MIIIALLLLGLAVWIVVPAPTGWLLPVAIGVPEVSPFVLVASILTLTLCLRLRESRKLAALICLIAAGLSAIPMSQFPAAAKAFDRELASVFPPRDARGGDQARPSRFVLREFLAGISTGDVRVDRNVKFASPHGVQLVLDVFQPARSGKFPVLLQIHGGSWQRGRPGDNETFARYFAGRGYVVVASEYRLAPRWRWPAAFEDVQAALDWIPTHASSYQGDPDRVAVIGRSAGGHLALLGAYSGRHGVRAAVSLYGPTDLVEGWRTPPDPDPADTRTILETFLGGTPDSAPVAYRDASPIEYVTSAAPPTLQIFGKRDHVVLPKFGRALHEKLRTARAKSVYLEIPWSEHAFDAVPHGLGGQLALYYMERFLDRALATPGLR